MYQSGNMTEKRGLLTKFNLRGCECGKVQVPELQASKGGIEQGWYPDVSTLRMALEDIPEIDPVVRMSSTQRGKITCFECQESDQE